MSIGYYIGIGYSLSIDPFNTYIIGRTIKSICIIQLFSVDRLLISHCVRICKMSSRSEGANENNLDEACDKLM